MTQDEIRHALHRLRASLRRWLIAEIILACIPVFAYALLMYAPLPSTIAGISLLRISLHDILVLSARTFIFLGAFALPHLLTFICALLVVSRAFPIVDRAYGRRKIWQQKYLAIAIVTLVFAVAFDVLILLIRYQAV